MNKTDLFIKKAIDIRGNEYDLSLAEYKGVHTKIIVICRNHGPWGITPNNYLKGRGCPVCAKEKAGFNQRISHEMFIDKCLLTHGDRYDYSKTLFINYKTKVTITCKIHGDFKVMPYSHADLGRNCIKCSSIHRSNNKSTKIILDKYKDVIQPIDYKIIPLGGNYFAKVDNEDFDRLKSINWYKTAQGYARSNKNGFMHRFIDNTPIHLFTDHINRDRLDNRKSNLRSCTASENVSNKGAHGRTSKYKGVHKTKSGKWRAIVSKNGFGIFGTFDNEDDAAIFYNEKASEMHKEFANLNIIKTDIYGT